MDKTRNSNIELLRIISIVMIVVSHYCVHGAGVNVISNLNFGINRFLLEFLVLGNLGSILFILISGYYLINSNKVKYKKILRLIFQVEFYSILIYLLLVLLNIQPFEIKDFIKSVFPISFKSYWFVTSYIILYLFHPYINKLLNALNKKEHFNLICLMFIIFSVLHFITTSDYYGNELIQFLLFYSIGGYLSKYPNNLLGDKKNNLKITVISATIIILSIILIDYLGKYYSIFNSHSTYFLSRTSPFAILFCVGLFDLFARKKANNKRFVNIIASLIFGVYLISDNKYFRPILWKDIFNNIRYVESQYLFFHIIIVVSLTILGCLIIELIRKILIERFLFNYLDVKIDNFQNKIEKKFDLKK